MNLESTKNSINENGNKLKKPKQNPKNQTKTNLQKGTRKKPKQSSITGMVTTHHFLEGRKKKLDNAMALHLAQTTSNLSSN